MSLCMSVCVCLGRSQFRQFWLQHSEDTELKIAACESTIQGEVWNTRRTGCKNLIVNTTKRRVDRKLHRQFQSESRLQRMQSCTSLICHYDYLHYFKVGKIAGSRKIWTHVMTHDRGQKRNWNRDDSWLMTLGKTHESSEKPKNLKKLIITLAQYSQNSWGWVITVLADQI